jgi:hypothetical protein
MYLNNKNGTFKDITREARLDRTVYVMGINYGDIDNDGYPDIYAGTGFLEPSYLFPNLMFRNASGKYFEDVTHATGLGHLQKGHGIAFGDIDNDGDQDMYEVMGGGFSGDVFPNVLFRNPGNDHRWIKIRLEGVQTNRAAIGARIKVVVQTAEGEKDIHWNVCTGASFGANPLRAEIGLGNATAIKRVEVFWPVTGKTQTFRGLDMGKSYRIREGGEHAREEPLKKIDFSTSQKTKHHHSH